jgi:probable selenium-dependent hydroxylase accessory protein YqeC
MLFYRKTNLLSLLADVKFVSFVGGGGKTSLSEYFARRAAEQGIRVAVTTTTKIWARHHYLTFGEFLKQSNRNMNLPLCIGKNVDKGKLTGLDEDEVQLLGNYFDLVLIEADGAKELPLKYPERWEPVVPRFSDRIMVVVGLDGLSGTIREKVFRHHLFTKVAGYSEDTPLSTDIVLRLLNEDGMLKGVDTSKAVIVFNKYDICQNRDKALELASRCCREILYGLPVVVASVHHGIFYEVGLSG